MVPPALMDPWTLKAIFLPSWQIQSFWFWTHIQPLFYNRTAQKIGEQPEAKLNHVLRYGYKLIHCAWFLKMSFALMGSIRLVTLKPEGMEMRGRESRNLKWFKHTKHTSSNKRPEEMFCKWNNVVHHPPFLCSCLAIQIKKKDNGNQ